MFEGTPEMALPFQLKPAATARAGVVPETVSPFQVNEQRSPQQTPYAREHPCLSDGNSGPPRPRKWLCPSSSGSLGAVSSLAMVSGSRKWLCPSSLCLVATARAGVAQETVSPFQDRGSGPRKRLRPSRPTLDRLLIKSSASFETGPRREPPVSSRRAAPERVRPSSSCSFVSAIA